MAAPPRRAPGLRRTALAGRHRQGRTTSRGEGRARRRGLARLGPVQHGDDRAEFPELRGREGRGEVPADPSLPGRLRPRRPAQGRGQGPVAVLRARNRRRLLRGALLLWPRDPSRSRRPRRPRQHLRRRHAHRVLGLRRDPVVGPRHEGTLRVPAEGPRGIRRRQGDGRLREAGRRLEGHRGKGQGRRQGSSAQAGRPDRQPQIQGRPGGSLQRQGREPRALHAPWHAVVPRRRQRRQPRPLRDAAHPTRHELARALAGRSPVRLGAAPELPHLELRELAASA